MLAYHYFLVLCLSIFSLSSLAKPPSSFDEAKKVAQPIYASADAETLYCGCSINWTKGSSGKPDLKSCNYQVRENTLRANRIEWEHIVPASTFGQQHICWRNGGRSNCRATDPIFNEISGNLFNLYPTVGEVNADRLNYKMAVLPPTPNQYGKCESKVSTSLKGFEPRKEARGLIARTYFFMYDYYGMQLSSQQEKLLMAWDSQYPVQKSEIERDTRIAKIMGYNNPFVTGEKKWISGFKPEGKGIAELNERYSTPTVKRPIHGNRKSRIYHLSSCPSYSNISPANLEEFPTEQAATDAGYRIAKNC